MRILDIRTMATITNRLPRKIGHPIWRTSIFLSLIPYRIRTARRDHLWRIGRPIVVKMLNRAGLDGEIMGVHPHNAMTGLRHGKPWRGVNYPLVRLASVAARLFAGHWVWR